MFKEVLIISICAIICQISSAISQIGPHMAGCLSRVSKGSRELIPFFKEYQAIKKRRVSTFSEFKHIERANGDFGRIFQMAISYPLSPMYFFYAYLVSPVLTRSPWAWKSWPSCFDSQDDAKLRWDVQNKRALDGFMRGLIALSEGSGKDKPSAHSTSAQVRKVESILNAKNVWGMLDAADEWIYVDSKAEKKTGSNTKAKVDKIPARLIKDVVRAFGSEGVPNIPFLNQLNRNELNSLLVKLKTSDDFLDTIRVDDLSDCELDEACRERFIPVVRRSQSDKRRDLNTWLDAACLPQDSVQGKFANEQNRRLILLGYFCSKDVKISPKATIYRSVFQ